MTFSSWRKVNEYNEIGDNPIYCKTQLSRMGLKPKPDIVPETHKVYYDGHWDDFNFYTLDMTVEKRKVSRIVKEFDITPNNICAALYIINKSAKVSRDTAHSKYEEGNHLQAKRSKVRKDELYLLKNKTMRKLISEGILVLAGYNVQTLQRYKAIHSSCCDSHKLNNSYMYFGCDNDVCAEEIEEQHKKYLLLYKYSTYSFHMPCESKPKNLPLCGEINDLITSKAIRYNTMKFTEAVNLLRKYCDIPNTNVAIALQTRV